MVFHFPPLYYAVEEVYVMSDSWTRQTTLQIVGGQGITEIKYVTVLRRSVINSNPLTQLQSEH